MMTLMLPKGINLDITKGQLVGICGSVGSGKSSLLLALLGMMPKAEAEKDSMDVTVHGSVALVTQEAWIQSMTLKNNILFGSPFDPARYAEVLDVCCLRADLEMLPDGDQTEIGERGLNLSGGQKQRVAMARAVYANRDIYLLDDPLSAVDAHVGRRLFDVCIQQFLRDKTVIFVSHQLQYLPSCDAVTFMVDGQVTQPMLYAELRQQNADFVTFVDHAANAGAATAAAVNFAPTRNNASIESKDVPESGREEGGNNGGSDGGSDGGSAAVSKKDAADSEPACSDGGPKSSAPISYPDPGSLAPVSPTAKGVYGISFPGGQSKPVLRLRSAGGNSTVSSTKTRANAGDGGIKVDRAGNEGLGQKLVIEGGSNINAAAQVSMEGVSFETFQKFASAGGGQFLALCILASFVVAMGGKCFSDWWLSHWINQGNGTSIDGDLSDNPKTDMFMGVYIGSGMGFLVLQALRGCVTS